MMYRNLERDFLDRLCGQSVALEDLDLPRIDDSLGEEGNSVLERTRAERETNEDGTLLGIGVERIEVEVEGGDGLFA
jgi:hypothetical protein